MANNKERAERLKECEMQVEMFNRQMFNELHNLHLADVSFVIFDIQGTTLYAGLHNCCGRNLIIRDEIRNDFECAILEKTQFNEVIWEL